MTDRLDVKINAFVVELLDQPVEPPARVSESFGHGNVETTVREGLMSLDVRGTRVDHQDASVERGVLESV